ncbi:MAG TPA: VOC family protein [Herpetosiphonaceae bacterium]
MKIALVSLFVSNPLEAHAFYTDVLGFESRMFMPEHYLAIVAAPGEPGSPGLLLEPNNNPIASTYQTSLFEANLPAIVFSVADLPSEHERLTGRGVAFRQEPTQTDYGLISVFEDGFGNLVQLMQA